HGIETILQDTSRRLPFGAEDAVLGSAARAGNVFLTGANEIVREDKILNVRAHDAQIQEDAREQRRDMIDADILQRWFAGDHNHESSEAAILSAVDVIDYNI